MPSTEIPAAVRRLVYERSGGICERCYYWPATNVHHRVARQKGGSRHTPWINLPSNLPHLCGGPTWGCHGFATQHPLSARPDGWVVPRGVAEQLGGCELVAMRDIHDRWWLLTDDGRRLRVSRVAPLSDVLSELHPEGSQA